MGVTLCCIQCAELPSTPIHHCPSPHLALCLLLSLFHPTPQPHSSWVSCLFIFLLFPLISHVSQRHSLTHTHTHSSVGPVFVLPPLLLIFFKFPEHTGLSYFSISVTTSSLLFPAIAAHHMSAFPLLSVISPY